MDSPAFQQRITTASNQALALDGFADGAVDALEAAPCPPVLSETQVSEDAQVGTASQPTTPPTAPRCPTHGPGHGPVTPSHGKDHRVPTLLDASGGSARRIGRARLDRTVLASWKRRRLSRRLRPWAESPLNPPGSQKWRSVRASTSRCRVRRWPAVFSPPPSTMSSSPRPALSSDSFSGK